MTDRLRICLFDAEHQPEMRFRAAFDQIRDLVIVGEASTWDELKERLHACHVDAVAVNLGEQKSQGIAVVQRISESAPGVGILGVSRSTDPQVIISAMRVGCQQFVAWPIDADDLCAALARIRAGRARTAQVSQRICVVGSAGGAGATTIACNLAMELGQIAGRHCALVDMNLEFGDICSTFDCNPSFGINDLCQGEAEIDPLLLGKAMHDLPYNVSLLRAPRTIQEVHSIHPESIVAMLKVMATMYPYVVIDLPRSYAYLSVTGLEHADHILIVTQLGVPFIRNATRILDYLHSLGVDDERVRIVLNRCNAAMDRISPDDVEEHFRRPIFAKIPNDFRRVQSSLDLGHPLVASAPNSRYGAAIAELARKIINPDGDGNGLAEGRDGQGLFKRLLGRGSRARV